MKKIMFATGMVLSATLLFSDVYAMKARGLEGKSDLTPTTEISTRVKQKNVQLFQLVKKHAEQGHAPAQLNLGIMYYTGEGVRKIWNKRLNGIGKPLSKNMITLLETVDKFV